MQNQSSLNNRRSSFVKVDKRTELDCENRPIYTQKSRVEGVITACRVLKFIRKVPRKSCDLCHVQDVIS